MLNVKTLNKLAVITCIIAVPIIVVVMHASGSALKHNNEPLYPEINKAFDNVTKIDIKSQNETLTLVRTGESWGLAERHNYPVQADKVQELLHAVANLKIVEPKTTNSLLYEQLDLADLSAPQSKACQLVLLDAQQKQVANVLVGKREVFQTGDQYSERIFIRKSGDNQAWLVQGLLPINMNVRDWLAQPMENIVRSDDVKRITVSKAGASQIVIAKDNAEQEDFVLENAPSQAGMKLDADAVNTVPFEVAEVEFVDIIPAADKQLDWSQGITAQVETFPGLALDLNIVRDADMVYAKVTAKTAEGADAALQQQAAQFNAKTQDWYYKLAPEFYNTIDLAASDFLQVDEVLETK